ncbi:MAG TPA: methyltransferase domain-containing protein [Amaricoccus sp.]|uniref:methyltransferase domain-containing protein n=1 Tax=Amaricoccus sp. TaxID=1872485 RepID=UPI002CF69122|nr:methyltransferase domain-containing protein [Amaricoccus sp.]HMQ95289.1 methyltransferase domain-containing protein [Amaricoccus sp.]HMR52909.1 methyltransferase domain-containing protein [Amaricoccus sp.]HMR60899.1 methyltransferase domain-containing protein [Amaricoccus sp.]HMT97759.1 methyltransferase domain-containing protein [Amaricoccus sp.]
MDDAATGQVSTAAAEIYESFFVPALFGQFAAPAAEAARIAPAACVLDVACGTGALTRALAHRAGPQGRVVGLDRNPGMLAVARRAAPGIDWREGRAEGLHYNDAAFDAVTCQFGLMFFEDRTAALRQMWRVLRPGGRLVVTVWDDVAHSPGYAAMLALLERLFGAETAAGLRAPFVLGDPADFAAELAAAAIPGAALRTLPGIARFPSIADWVHTDIRGWTLADAIDDAQYARLQEAARDALAGFAAADGSVAFAAPIHLAVARKA